MKQYVQAEATKVEEKKDPETGAISYRVVLETVQTITVNSTIKPEIGKDQIFEVSHYDFNDKDGKRVKGFKILGSLK